MPDLTPAARKAMAYWGVIEYAAAEGLSTADLWANIREAADEMGLASPGVSAAGVAQLRGIAGVIQHSGRRFERADTAQLIDGRMIGEAPYHRPYDEMNALGIYHVRYQHTTFGPDGPETNWRTSIFTGSLPATVEDLHAALAEDVNELANKYGVGHLDYGSVQILSV